MNAGGNLKLQSRETANGYTSSEVLTPQAASMYGQFAQKVFKAGFGEAG
jgi:hypothetical protein